MLDRNDPMPLVRHAVDWATASAVAGAIVGFIPPLLTVLAMLFGMVWYGIQIYESKTFQNWLERRRK